jgi:hypothetical protein
VQPLLTLKADHLQASSCSSQPDVDSAGLEVRAISKKLKQRRWHQGLLKKIDLYFTKSFPLEMCKQVAAIYVS